MNAKVSIVVNTLNRASLLRNTLESFRGLDYPNFEVVVVNGPSTDDTPRLLAEWSSQIKAGNCPEANLSMSRNIGIAMSSGDIVAFIDDDAVPEPEWLNQLVQAFEDSSVAAAGGKVFDHSGYHFQYEFAVADRLGNGKWRMSKASPELCFPDAFEFPYLQGTNTSFRMSALREIGGFDEAYAYYLDETDVCLRLIDRGYVVRQLPSAYVHHKYAPSYVRTVDAAIYRFPVLKSKVYFSCRHGIDHRPYVDIMEDNVAFMRRHQDDVLRCIAAGKLPSEALNAFEIHVRQAFLEGAAHASQTPRLMTRELLVEHASEFKQWVRREVVDSRDRRTIVLLCEDYPPNLLGGIARYTQDKARALAALGHKVHVIARSLDRNTVDLEDGVWVHRIMAAHHPVPKAHSHLRIPQSHWDQSYSFLEEVRRIATHRRVDIVEAPIWNVVGIAVLLSGEYPLVTTLMTTLKLSLSMREDLSQNRFQLDGFVNPIIDLEKLLVHTSHAILAISEGIAEKVQTAYEAKNLSERLFVSYLGLDDWAKRARKAAWKADPLSESLIRVLFVGRLENRKGIDVLLRVIPELARRHQNVRFNIVGNDKIPTSTGRTYRAQFEADYPALCGKSVFFHGCVSDDELMEHYATCDVFVAPSRFESFGLIYLEAMMFAKPVVGCDAGGVAEVVKQDETGLLVEPENEQQLLAAIERLLTSPELRKRLGQNGRKRYETRFSAEVMAKDSARIYEELLTKRQTAVGE